MDKPKLKVCSTCRVAKPTSAFWRNRKRPDGYQNQCRGCMRVSIRVSAPAKPDDGPVHVSQETINRLLAVLDAGSADRRVLKRRSKLQEDCFGVALATCLSLCFVGFRQTESGVVFYRRQRA